MLSFDLHTHSSCSDGELSPEELAREAAERKVSVLALTDHDTSSGTERASAAARKLGVCLMNFRNYFVTHFFISSSE